MLENSVTKMGGEETLKFGPIPQLNVIFQLLQNFGRIAGLLILQMTLQCSRPEQMVT